MEKIEVKTRHGVKRILTKPKRGYECYIENEGQDENLWLVDKTGFAFRVAFDGLTGERA